VPLTKEQKTQIKGNIQKAEVALKDAVVDIATAKRAGLDVSEQEKEVNRIRIMLRGVKAVYG